MKVLAIDDEFSFLRILKSHFIERKWQIETAATPEEAQSKLADKEFDVIICDYQLSEDPETEQGLEFVQKIRQQGICTPVLFLTGKRLSTISPWQALDAGVDDFMKKPCNMRELIARIKAIVRRNYACQYNATNMIRQNGICVNLSKRRVLIEGKEIHFGSTLFLLLKKLLQRPNVIITYNEFIEYIWGILPHFSPEESRNRLRVHVSNLKKKLGPKYRKKLRTIHSIGYIWEVEDRIEGKE